MANLETVKKWEELRQELEMWRRTATALGSEIWSGAEPKEPNMLQAPWWWFEGFRRDPTEPEPRVNLIESAIIWELAIEAIRTKELSETSTTLLAIKESGILQTVLEAQAKELERTAEKLRMKSASLARKGV